MKINEQQLPPFFKPTLVKNGEHNLSKMSIKLQVYLFIFIMK